MGKIFMDLRERILTSYDHKEGIHIIEQPKILSHLHTLIFWKPKLNFPISNPL